MNAVEWYAEQAMRLELEKAKGNISINEMLNQLSNVLNQAKELDKQNLLSFGSKVAMKAHLGQSGWSIEQLYNEMFEK
jgi:hypothetical protein